MKIQDPHCKAEMNDTLVLERPVINEGKLWFNYHSGILNEKFSVTVPDDFRCHNDLLIAFFISIFGSAFPKVFVNFSVSENCLLELSSLAAIDIESNGRCNQWRPGSTPYLAFSGGLDSLAAHLLLPDYFKLASIDFGAKFSRERTFFEKFDTTIITTDFRQSSDKNLHWMFMGAPLILFAEYLNMTGFGFGTVFEATVAHLTPPHYQHRIARSFRNAVSLNDLTITRGITEFATAKIVCRLAPNLVIDSLRSLAQEGTEKQFRKQLFIKRETMNATDLTSDSLSSLRIPAKKIKIGTSFALDLVYLAFATTSMKNLILSTVENPDSVIRFLSSNIDMSWVDRYNPAFLGQLPYNCKGDMINSLHDVGIPLFSNADFENYGKYREYWIANSGK